MDDINTSETQSTDPALKIFYLCWLLSNVLVLMWVWPLNSEGRYALFIACPLLNASLIVIALLYFAVAKLFKLALVKNFLWYIFIPPFLTAAFCALAISN